jgi:hypothetical protein
MRSAKSFIQSIIVMSIIIILISMSPISTALADTVGPNNPTLGTNQAGIGTEVWQNPENNITPGSRYATVTLNHGHLESNYLQGMDYGFY